MNIESEKKIYAITCGMVAAGYDLYTTAWVDLYDFAQEAAQLTLDEDIKGWFKKARTGQAEVNPYWPRGHAVLSAVFFIDGDGFDIDGFIAFFDETGVTDPFSRESFREWIAELPRVLEYMDKKAAGLWEKYKTLLNHLTYGSEPLMIKTRKIADDFFEGEAKELLFAPNPLYSPYATDFVHTGNKIVVIGHSCDTESMLHEALHIEVAKYRDKITAFSKKHSNGAFADLEKMIYMGYIDQKTHVDEYNESYIRVIEECFVRGISTVLAGGGARRLTAHAHDGFGSVPIIGTYFEQSRPKASELGAFIDSVLEKFI